MNWVRWEIFLGISVWAIPLLGLIYLTARAKAIWIILLLRLVYFPYFALMTFGLYWFWAGDGFMNLWLVPAVLIFFAIILFKWLKPKWAGIHNRFEVFFFFLTLAGYLTVCAVMLIYALIQKPLVIT